VDRIAHTIDRHGRNRRSGLKVVREAGPCVAQVEAIGSCVARTEAIGSHVA
jgi:hypothetical protein